MQFDQLKQHNFITLRGGKRRMIRLLPDPGMNYMLNRPLLDGTSPVRLSEIGGNRAGEQGLRKLLASASAASFFCRLT
jgi:hypothetical protein